MAHSADAKMVPSKERRSRDYGFESIDSMLEFFSRWIPKMELNSLVQETEQNFLPRKESSLEEMRLQKIQKAEFAIVRRLVHRKAGRPR